VVRAIGLGVLFGVGMIFGVVLAPVIFLISFVRGGRAFHPRGTTCRASVVALDPDVGGRLAGEARVRLSGAAGDENSDVKTVLGMAIKLANGQDLPLATFEAFVKLGAATKDTNIGDYLANEYASVTPWRVHGLGIVWLRAIPNAHVAATGTRVDRLDAAIAAGHAKLVLEAREAPGPTAAVRRRLAELSLVERTADDKAFTISMFHTAAGFVPTGVRNGIRGVVYPTSQLARRLRGG